MKFTTKIMLATVAGLMTLASPPAVRTVYADPPVAEWEASIFRVDNGSGWGTGWLLNNDGYVATNWHVVDGASDFTLTRGGTQNSYAAELVWQGDGARDMAILHVPGLSGRPFKLNTTDPERGMTSYTAGFPGVADQMSGGYNTNISVYRGTISLVVENAWGVRILQHDTRVNAGNSGGPLLDECGRVHGLTTWSRNTLAEGSDDVVWASVHIAELAGVLDQLGISYQTDNSSCQLETTGPMGEVSDDLARQEAQQASENAAEATRRAQGAEAALEKLRDFVVTGGIALWVLLAVVVVLLLRRPRQRIVRAIEEASRSIRRPRNQAPHSDAAPTHHAGTLNGLILSGFAASGRTIRIDFSRRDLAAAGKGISLGRAADLVDQVIEDKEISRRHARIVWGGDRFLVEDLNSTNGTSINGRMLTPFEPSELRTGDILKLGQVELSVTTN